MATTLIYPQVPGTVVVQPTTQFYNPYNNNKNV